MISIRFLVGRLDILERIPLVLWAFMGVSVFNEDARYPAMEAAGPNWADSRNAQVGARADL
jgi:hypothetical protein